MRTTYDMHPDKHRDGDAALRLGRLRAELEAAQGRLAHLEKALDSNRAIGVAIGIVMAREALTQDAAWERLVTLSQARQQKVRDLADEIVYTGDVPEDEQRRA